MHWLLVLIIRWWPWGRLALKAK